MSQGAAMLLGAGILTLLADVQDPSPSYNSNKIDIFAEYKGGFDPLPLNDLELREDVKDVDPLLLDVEKRANVPTTKMSMPVVAPKELNSATDSLEKMRSINAKMGKLNARVKTFGSADQLAKQKAAIKVAEEKVAKYQKLVEKAKDTKAKLEKKSRQVLNGGKVIKRSSVKDLDQLNREHRAAIEAVNRGEQAAIRSVDTAKAALRAL